MPHREIEEARTQTGTALTSFASAPAGWDEFVATHPDAKLYHRSTWCTLVDEVLGHHTDYHVLRQDEVISAVLPLTTFKSLLFGKMGISLPYVNYGGPLMKDLTHSGRLFKYLHGLRTSRQLKLIELRAEAQLSTDLPCSGHKVTFRLDLPEEADTLLASFKAKVRSQIRRPEKEQMFARRGGKELLADFYGVFARNMRDLGTPPLPRKFFARILETFRTESFVTAVYSRDQQPVAAAFLLRHGGCMEIPWASSLREYNRYSPNMMLYWESLKLAIEQGCARFDFGRCSPESGTYRFKKQWGAEEIPLYWYYVLPPGSPLPRMNPSNPKYDLAIRIWRSLPLPLTNSIGPLIIKHIP